MTDDKSIGGSLSLIFLADRKLNECERLQEFYERKTSFF